MGSYLVRSYDLVDYKEEDDQFVLLGVLLRFCFLKYMQQKASFSMMGFYLIYRLLVKVPTEEKHMHVSKVLRSYIYRVKNVRTTRRIHQLVIIIYILYMYTTY